MEKLLIKNALVADPEKADAYRADIYCEDGKIAKIGCFNEIPENTRVLDVNGAYAGPGLVDVHVHFRDPGFTYKEDIFTGALSAARGGFTSVVLMANTRPVVDNGETLRYVIDKGSETAINIYTCAAVTEGLLGEKLVDLEALYEGGAVGFTDDGKPILNAFLVREAMKRAAALNAPVSFHEENPRFIKANGINALSPREAEMDLIGRDLELALETGAQINIQHISSAEGVELVRRAREKAGLNNIHAEATPHHFSLTEEAVDKYGTNAKMNPPLRTEADRKAIIQGLMDGTIDLIATDHAPHSAEEKAKPLTEAPSGIIGLETALSLAITKLVEPGYLTVNELMRKMAYNPSRLYRLPSGTLAIGAPADLCIFSTRETVTYNSFASKSQNSPFIGQTLTGRVLYTICGGQVVWEN